jgi:hypothetical protein
MSEGAKWKSIKVQECESPRVQGGGRWRAARQFCLRGCASRFEAMLKACAMRRSGNGKGATSFMTIACGDIVDAGRARLAGRFAFAAKAGTAMPACRRLAVRLQRRNALERLEDV